MIQDKAQSAANGSALCKGCNAVLDHLARSLRASRQAPAPARGVAALAKGAAIAREPRLALERLPTRYILNRQMAGVLVLLVLALAAVATQAEEDPYRSVRERLQTCISCHGENGASNNPDYPVLAGQQFYYLYVQLKDYKSGLRDNAVMGPVSSGLEKADMKLLAKYFSEQSWPAHEYEATPAQRAEAQASITAGQCVACHLSGFEGDSRVPRASGQHPRYLEQTMLDFKTRARNNSPSKSSLMASMSEEEIASVAAYLGALRPD